MYRITTLAALLAMLILAAPAQAAPFSISFTADNSLTEFQFAADGDPLADMPGFTSEGSGGDWKSVATFSQDLTVNNTYVFQWQVTNYNNPKDKTLTSDPYDGKPGTGNPTAFMADIVDPTGFSYTTSGSTSWEVAKGVYDSSTDSYSPGAWVAATEYALNDGTAYFTKADIWYNNGGTIAGISEDAAWIGLGDYPGTSDTEVTYVRVSYTATPIPGAAWLMGSGLLGIVGFMRLRRQA